MHYIYSDETWVDSYARTGKGWVINSPKSFHEAALYSFQNPKISRGPRIIVMHAGAVQLSTLNRKLFQNNNYLHRWRGWIRTWRYEGISSIKEESPDGLPRKR